MTNPKTRTTEPKQVSKELQMAGEVHTLANLIYRELVATRPWMAGTMTPSVFSEPVVWPPVTSGEPASRWLGTTPWFQ